MQLYKLCDTTMTTENREDRLGNEIGNGNYHVNYNVYEIEDVFTEVQESENTESVYVFYSCKKTGKSIACRFSSHTCNAVELGDKLNGYFACENEIKFRLGLMKREAILVEKKYIPSHSVKRTTISQYEVAPYTFQELYDMPLGTDLSKYIGMIASGSHRVIDGNMEILNPYTLDRLGNKLYQVEKFLYSPIIF